MQKQINKFIADDNLSL